MKKINFIKILREMMNIPPKDVPCKSELFREIMALLNSSIGGVCEELLKEYEIDRENVKPLRNDVVQQLENAQLIMTEALYKWFKSL